MKKCKKHVFRPGDVYYLAAVTMENMQLETM